MLQVGGGQPSHKISDTKFLWFGSEGILKILADLINQLVTKMFVEQPWLHRVC